MLRNVFCEQIMGSGISSVVDNSLCDPDGKPSAQKPCTDDDEMDSEDAAPKVNVVSL